MTLLLGTSVQEISPRENTPFQSARVMNGTNGFDSGIAMTSPPLPPHPANPPALYPSLPPSSLPSSPLPSSLHTSSRPSPLSSAGAGCPSSGPVWVMAEVSHGCDNDIRFGIPETDPVAPSSSAFDVTRRSPPRSPSEGEAV
jgi:hypothetical protein